MIVYLDTNIVIYLIEDPQTWGQRAELRIAASKAAGDTLQLSDLTRMECLVKPLKTGDASLEAEYHAFFTSTGVQVVPVTAGVCDRAARSRRRHGFKPMDALQLAAAAEHGAGVFLTNDLRLSAFTALAVEVLA